MVRRFAQKSTEVCSYRQNNRSRLSQHGEDFDSYLEMLWMLWKDRHIYKRMDVAGNCSLLGGVVYGLTICFAPFILLYFLSSSLSLFSWISFGAISPGLLGYGCLFDSSQGASLSIALLHFSSLLSVSFDAVARVVYSCLQSGLVYVWRQLRWNGRPSFLMELHFCV